LALTIIAATMLCSSGHAAPALDEEMATKKSFSTLKERLPKAVEAWLKDVGYEKHYVAEVKSARRIEATKGKVAIVVSRIDSSGNVPPKVVSVELVVMIFLQYYDGRWTTTRFEPLTDKDRDWLKDLGVLMVAIDESDGN
jgi:hypothetical protein